MIAFITRVCFLVVLECQSLGRHCPASLNLHDNRETRKLHSRRIRPRDSRLKCAIQRGPHNGDNLSSDCAMTKSLHDENFIYVCKSKDFFRSLRLQVNGWCCLCNRRRQMFVHSRSGFSIWTTTRPDSALFTPASAAQFPAAIAICLRSEALSSWAVNLPKVYWIVKLIRF